MDKKAKTFYKKYEKYSITINPCDKYQCLGQPDRLTEFKNFMNEQFIGYPSHGIHYEFHIELSEPREIKQGQAGPRLHLHGWVEFKSSKSIRHWLLHEMYNISRYAYMQIDTISHLADWKLYCEKQKDIMQIGILTNITNTLVS